MDLFFEIYFKFLEQPDHVKSQILILAPGGQFYTEVCTGQFYTDLASCRVFELPKFNDFVLSTRDHQNDTSQIYLIDLCVPQ